MTCCHLSNECATTNLKGASKLVQPCFQEEFAALHAKYKEVKAQRIQDVEEAITEIRTQEQVRSKKAMQVLSPPPAVLCTVQLDTHQLPTCCKQILLPQLLGQSQPAHIRLASGSGAECKWT